MLWIIGLASGNDTHFNQIVVRAGGTYRHELIESYLTTPVRIQLSHGLLKVAVRQLPMSKFFHCTPDLTRLCNDELCERWTRSGACK